MKRIYFRVFLCLITVCCLILCACDARKSGEERTDGSSDVSSAISDNAGGDIAAIDVYVSNDGSDDNDGSKEAPFATFKKVRNALRKLRKNAKDVPVTVHIAEGEYRITNIDLTFQDGGGEGAPVTYKGEGNVILNGGMSLDASVIEVLTDEEKARLHGDAPEKVVRVDLIKLGLTSDDWGELCAIGTYNTANMYDGGFTSPMWCELFVNNERQEIARYPDADFLYTGKYVHEGQGLEHQGKKKMDSAEWYALRNPESDIYSIDKETAARVATWKTTDGAWVFGYPQWNWADMSSPVTSIDTETGEMALEYVSLYGMKDNAPYYFYNVFEELDSPGEWYLDRVNGILYFYPPEGCDVGNADITLSLSTEPLLTSTGIKYINFENITFTGTRGDAIDVSGQYITFENCTVSNVAGNAMRINGNNNTVRGCEIMHTGRGGILMEGGDRETLTSSGGLIENNHIHHIAEIYRTYQPGVDLKGVGIVCRNNSIHDSAHMAIGFSGNDHIMEYNEVYAVCQIADDSGAIYSGRDYTTQGNIIRYNYFHDMVSDAERNVGIFAVYCDDNLGGTTIHGNVFERCQSAILLHGGHDMTITNNLIIDDGGKKDDSIKYRKYGYPETLKAGGTHITRMDALPWESDVWKNAYPHLSEYLTWDTDTEALIPHYGNVTNNVIIAHSDFDVNFDLSDERLHTVVADNTFMDELPADSVADLCASVLPQKVAGFEAIPFGEMGMKAD